MFSFPNEDVRSVSVRVNDAQVQIVTRVLGTRVVPLAAMVTRRRTTDLVWFAPGSSAGPTAPLQGFERLYHLAFQQTPNRQFQAHRFDATSLPPRGGGGTQGDALRIIASARGCALAAFRNAVPGSTLRSWASVRMKFVGPVRPSVATVAVRATDAQGRPVPGGSVTFARGPHFACTARLDVTGVARCKLVNTYRVAGEDAHEDDREPTIATFAGSVDQDPLLLPTTEVAAGDGRAARRGP